MTINKAKASSYTSVKPQYVADYIKQYSQKITEQVNGAYYSGKLAEKNKTQLNAIAAELETVCKRLDYILEGKY